jgi:hypothetical protein
MTIFTGSPAAGEDDGYWQSATFQNVGTAASFGNSAGNIRNAFFRIPSITIPKNAIINSAYLTLNANTAYSGTTCNANIAVELADSATQCTSVADANGRSKSSYVVWSSIAAWSSNTSYSTPDFASLISSIVSRSGWASGNAIQIFILDNSSSSNALRGGKTYNNGSGIPVLTIDYSDTGIVPVVMNQIRRRSF